MILTQPDYRLSFELKLYESTKKLKEGDETIKHYLRTYRWINENVRNVLDESDAILTPNYQLIYTIGDQFAPDGGEQRWLVIQALLKRVPHHMNTLYNKWKTANQEAQTGAPVEFDVNNYVTNDPNIKFTPCRIIDETVFDELRAACADDFLDGKLDIKLHGILDEHTRKQLRNLIIKGDKESFQILERFQEEEKRIIWIVSGMLRYEVLKLVLIKRWRVNYGVDPRGPHKMAIPFKAKDVPSDSEFGHTDVAICFTQLSYYYSG